VGTNGTLPYSGGGRWCRDISLRGKMVQGRIVGRFYGYMMHRHIMVRTDSAGTNKWNVQFGRSRNFSIKSQAVCTRTMYVVKYCTVRIFFYEYLRTIFRKLYFSPKTKAKTKIHVVVVRL
jgi:hypothetical protein